jgi:ornithine cyclodeaminase/alanine dehydrogenase-like protein (mu-crystallin family)
MHASMHASVPFLSADEIHRTLAFPRLIDALAEGFRQGAEAPVRHVHAVNTDARLLLMPAWRVDEAIGVKLVTVFPANRARGIATVGALYVLLDGKTGHPRALLDGEALTLRRTGAASALAARYLARRDARTLVVVGTGALAPYMALAHAAVRDYEKVLVWGRNIERAHALCKRLVDEGLPAIPSTHLEEALAVADVITPGTHVDLVGGFTPHMREADDRLIARATLFVDTFAGALVEAGDLTQPLANGLIKRDAIVAELADLVAGRHPGRNTQEEITLFKSVGTALEDLTAAQLAAAQASA